MKQLGIMTQLGVICQYCNKPAMLVDRTVVHKHGYGYVWMCEPCDAYVGIHLNSPTWKPIGTLAKKDLRGLRVKVHKVFDKLWTDKKDRSKIYCWLSAKMGIPIRLTHISMFNNEQCEEALKHLEEYNGN